MTASHMSRFLITQRGGVWHVDFYAPYRATPGGELLGTSTPMWRAWPFLSWQSARLAVACAQASHIAPIDTPGGPGKGQCNLVTETAETGISHATVIAPDGAATGPEPTPGYGFEQPVMFTTPMRTFSPPRAGWSRACYLMDHPEQPDVLILSTRTCNETIYVPRHFVKPA